jgi:hypothetical protein
LMSFLLLTHGIMIINIIKFKMLHFNDYFIVGRLEQVQCRVALFVFPTS